MTGGLESEMLPAIVTTKTLIEDEFFLNWAFDGEDEAGEELLVGYLGRIKQRLNADTAFFVSATSQNYFTHEGAVRRVSQPITTIATALKEIGRAEQQNKNTESVATAVNEMEATVHEVAGNANIIERLQQGSKRAVTQMQVGQAATGKAVSTNEQMMESLNTINQQMREVVDLSFQVATATEEQSAVTAEINKEVQQISELSRTTSDDMQKCAQEINTLHRLAEDIEQVLRAFKL